MADTVTVRIFFFFFLRKLQKQNTGCEVWAVKDKGGGEGRREETMESLHKSAPTYHWVTWLIFALLTKQPSAQTPESLQGNLS